MCVGMDVKSACVGMDVSVCVYARVCWYGCQSVCVCVCACVGMDVRACVCVGMDVRACVCVLVWMSERVCVCWYGCQSVRVHFFTHIFVYYGPMCNFLTDAQELNVKRLWFL